MKSYVYINGVIAPEEDARVSPSDRGFLLGDGLFETVMAVEGVPLFLDAHIKRLKKGLKALFFEPASMQGLFRDIEDGVIARLLEAKGLSGEKARVRITISRGIGSGGLAPLSATPPTIIISASPVDMEKISRRQDLGIRAIIIKGFRPALPGVKSLNFMPNIIGARMAVEKKAGEGFFLAEDNRTVLEGTSSNIFIVTKGGLLTTPAAIETGGPGVLPGVVRQVVLGLAVETEIPAEQSWFTTEDLQTAAEVFITNSISGVVPVTEIDSRPVAEGKPGRVTRLLQKEYEKKISSTFPLSFRKKKVRKENQ